MREQGRYEIEVHVAPICFCDNSGVLEVLVARRASSRSLYPGKWECGGGQVKPGENFHDAVHRQIQEEFRIKVEIVGTLGPYEIATPELSQKKIPGIQFVCRYLQGTATIDPNEHTECRWLPINQLSELDFIGTLPDDILLGAKLI